MNKLKAKVKTNKKSTNLLLKKLIDEVYNK